MGGKALKTCPTERKTTDQFYDIAGRLIPKLESILGTELYILKFYRTKKDHGDMDILYKVNENFISKKLNVREEVEKHLYPKDIIVNDGTVSFEFENFQIDLSPVKEDVWESTKFWMNYDPTSNLCGKLFHRFGLKMGPDSLHYPYRGDSGQVMENIIITKDFRKMMVFLGLDPERKYQGFDTLEEIYNWIISSKYYNTELFLLDNLTQSDRKRNKKRPTFNKFLEYVKDMPYESEGYHFEKNKTKYLDLIDQSFPEVHFMEQIERLKKKGVEIRELKEKFNGQLVMSWVCGLKDKELGETIKKYRDSHTDEWIRNHTSDEVKVNFLSWFWGAGTDKNNKI